MTTRKVNKGIAGGKQKLWRKMATKGYGRQLRNALNGRNHDTKPTDPIIFLLKKAGIPTPNFDKVMMELYTRSQELKAKAVIESESNIIDVEPIVEGASV